MKKLVKTLLIMTAFVFAVGCAKKEPAPQPMVPAVPAKHKVKKHYSKFGKMGKTSYQKDTKK